MDAIVLNHAEFAVLESQIDKMARQLKRMRKARRKMISAESQYLRLREYVETNANLLRPHDGFARS